jgi:hypothetical protein
MFEKISRMAEKAATNLSVSRRGFLGRLGQSALGVAAVLAGFAATTASAKGGGSYVCCTWKCSNYGGVTYKTTSCLPPGTNCDNYRPCYRPLKLEGHKEVSSCASCK